MSETLTWPGIPEHGPDWFDSLSTVLNDGNVIELTGRQLQMSLGLELEQCGQIRTALIGALRRGYVTYVGTGADGDWRLAQPGDSPRWSRAA